MNRLIAAVLALASIPAWAGEPPPNKEYHQWRGPLRDGHSTDTGLQEKWHYDGCRRPRMTSS